MRFSSGSVIADRCRSIKLAYVSLLALQLLSCSHREPRKAQEAVLRQDLFTMREQIDNYTLDKKRAPQSLQELVSAGYLKEIPVDPFTNSRETWVPVQTEILASINQREPGISDVHSGSNL